MSEAKRVAGDEPVEANRQSKTTGIESGGTLRKLFHRDATAEELASSSFEAIDTLLCGRIENCQLFDYQWDFF